jgi:hypothetical protein
MLRFWVNPHQSANAGWRAAAKRPETAGVRSGDLVIILTPRRSLRWRGKKKTEPAINRRTGTAPLHEGYLPSVSWEVFMRSMLLWLIGIPLPIILILWLVTGHA